MRGKGTKLGERGKGSELSEPCPKVRLSQDRLLNPLPLISNSSLVQCLRVRPGAYPIVEYMKGASPGQALILLTLDLACKVKKTLAYWDHL